MLSEARDEARVSLVVEPGQRTIVEHVVLAGLDRTRDVTVEREMLLRPGEPFSFERVLESQRRLSSLGIFERVQISELDPGRERRRDVVVSVQEAPRTSWSWGVGYSEQDRLRGSVELTRRNLGGLGRTASVFARGSFRGSRLLLNLREPWLFGRRLDSFLTGFWEEEDRTSFDYNRKGGIVQAGRSLDSRTSLILRYLYQDTNVYNIEGSLDEIDRQYRTYAVSGPSASVVFDTRDDPLEPRRGLFLGADLQLSLDALGGESYLRSFFQAVRVSRLRADLVFVLSGRVGLAATFADEPPLLPLPERFFAGGDYGPRGFPVDGVGPKVVGTDGTLYPTGGNALVLGGAELRYNLSRSFQLASFLDTGNVYLETRDMALTDLRWSAGLGVRYRTPIGPIRLDWGYVLDHAAGRGALPLPPVDWACFLAWLRPAAWRSHALCPFPLSGRSASSVRFRPPDVPTVLFLRLVASRPRPRRPSRSPSRSRRASRPSSASSRSSTGGRCCSRTCARWSACAASRRRRRSRRSIDERLMYLEASRLPQAEVLAEEEQRAPQELLERRPELGDSVSAADLRRIVGRQIAILKYVEFRFRPQLRVSDQEVRAAFEADPSAGDSWEAARRGPRAARAAGARRAGRGLGARAARAGRRALRGRPAPAAAP